ncbi:MAG TPA: hypothetical protein VFB59_01540 [Candidatus Saccharimonadales bacterium]|nr:hypothetical protein [Candidatus Saccharimonadales bacterium]
MSEFDFPKYGDGFELPERPPRPREVGPKGQRWEYSEGEFLRDYTNALLADTPTGYPAFKDRLRLNDASQLSRVEGDNYVPLYIPYDARAPWCLNDYPATHPEYEAKFLDEGGVYPPTDEEQREWDALGIQIDQRGMPVHPYAKSMLLGGYTSEGEWVHPGGVVTPGDYFRRGRGPRKTADMLLVAEENEKLYGLFIERKNNGLLAIPGGHLEPADKQLSEQLDGQLNEYEVGGLRELEEETGMKIKITPRGLSCSGLTVVLKKIWAGKGADQRATLHAWPEGETFAAFLPNIPKQRPKASSDAKRVVWLPLSEDTLGKLTAFSNHSTMARRAIRQYRDETKTRIDPDGGIW